MKLVRITPELGGLPELATFQCPNCEKVTTIENDEMGQASKIRFSEKFRIVRQKSLRRKPAGALFLEDRHLGTQIFFGFQLIGDSDGSSNTNGYPIHSQPLPSRRSSGNRSRVGIE
jgi:hypothetical protein